MNYLQKFTKHLGTVNRHRFEVCKMCFKFGLYWQGLTHDLSKYNPIEFFSSVKYYQGNRSPIDAEKEIKGYSNAWLHHKSKNKHHAIHWIDYDSDNPNILRSSRIPLKYVYESIADSIGAGKIYSKNAGKEWSKDVTFNYYKNVERNKLKDWLNQETLMVLDIIYVDIFRYGLDKVTEMIKGNYYDKFYSKLTTNDGRKVIPELAEWNKIVSSYYDN